MQTNSMLCEDLIRLLVPVLFLISSSTFNLCSNHGRTGLFLLFKVLVIQAVLSPRFWSRFLNISAAEVSVEVLAMKVLPKAAS